MTTAPSSSARTGYYEWTIFGIALLSGTFCSICSKSMMQVQTINIQGTIAPFEKPIFQTITMFVGMLFGLVLHLVIVMFRIPFPGYEHATTTTTTPAKTSISYGSTDEQLPIKDNNNGNTATTTPATTSNTAINWSLYLNLAIPSIFDLIATALCMMGLQYLNVSMYQLLRGSGIIFVALGKQYVLIHPLYRFQWVGVALNVAAVSLVAVTAILNGSSENNSTDDGTAQNHPLLGVLLVLLGAVVQAMQFVFEEKLMKLDSAPPLLLIGMEGFWGTLLCIVVVYPIVYFLPGDDLGHYEDPFNTLYMITHSPTLQFIFVVYFWSILLYNVFAILVTFELNSVWHAILDNFRPLTVWAVGLFLYYGYDTNYGEPWMMFSFIQLIGLFVLIYGTSVYNAPNAGSVKLTGQWYDAGLDFRYEYEELEIWDRRKIVNDRRASSMAEMSPFLVSKMTKKNAIAGSNVLLPEDRLV